MSWTVKLAASAAVALASVALAQEATDDTAPVAAPINSTTGLRLPSNPELFGTTLPTEVRATAIVNGTVITQTDIDQRLALLAIANGGKIPDRKSVV